MKHASLIKIIKNEIKFVNIFKDCQAGLDLIIPVLQQCILQHQYLTIYPIISTC